MMIHRVAKRMKLKKCRRRSGKIVLEIIDYNGDTSRDKPDISRPPKKSHVGTSKANVNAKKAKRIHFMK